MMLDLTHDGRSYYAATPSMLAEAGVPAEAILEAARAQAKAAVDVEAEERRKRWITPGAGQAMTYLFKADEARRLLALPDPASVDPADYPMLAAEIGITAATFAGVAEVVFAAHQQWLVVGAAIEAVRLDKKASIGKAEDIAAIAAIVPAWPEAI